MTAALDDLPTRAEPAWDWQLPTMVLLVAVLGQALVVQVMMPDGGTSPANGMPAPPTLPDVWMLALPLALSYAVLLTMVSALARVKFGRPLRALPGFERAALRTHVLGAFTGLALYGVNVAFTAAVDVGIERTDLFHAVTGTRDLMVLALPVVVLAPIFEEVLFRGLFFGAFREAGVGRAIVGSAIVFAGVHLLTYAEAPLALVPVLVVGLANGALRARTGSIDPGITSHAVFNALGLVSWALQLRHGG